MPTPQRFSFSLHPLPKPTDLWTFAIGALSSNPDISKDLGTRHKAAIGVSENSDCVAVVVSEESGIVSMTYNGNIKRNLTKIDLKDYLEEFLGDTADQRKK